MSPGYGNNSATIGYAEIEVIGQSKTIPSKLRTNFITTIRNYLPEPVASFSIGLLIGQKTGLSADLQDTLRMAGLTHIIAVSGYNLTIIIRVVKRLLKRLSRFQVLAISFSLVLLFIGVTGMSPSILRAFIVTTLMLLSWYVGRKLRPVVLLLLAAAVSSLIEPTQLLSSVGWYLSFGAFTGVIIIAPLIIEKIKRKTLLKSIFIESFAASIMTLPIIALVFGQVSFTGILANSVVVPLIPLAMVCSIITYFGALVHPTLGFLVAYPTKYLLKFILDFAKEISLLPGTTINIQLHGVIAGIFYGLILMAVFALYSKKPVIDVLQ